MHNTKTFYITYTPTLQDLCSLAEHIDDTITAKHEVNILSTRTGEVYAVREENNGLWSFCGYAEKQGE